MDKGMLTDATSTDDSPTPGYLLNEIAHATVGSYAACTQLITFLNARLKKNNHNVKYKCCQIIKHVCRSGRADFKKDMARNLESLKDCLQYKGVPDPLRGDEIYRRVREAAKEALDAIFDSQQPVTSSNPSVASRIQGFSGGQEDDPQRRKSATSGNSSLTSFTSSAKAMLGLDSSSNYSGNHGAGGDFVNTQRSVPGSGSNNQTSNDQQVNRSGGGAYNGGTSSMTGIGNPNFQDPRKEEQNSLSSRIGAAASGLMSKISSSTTSPPSNQSGNNFNSSNSANNDDYQFRSNRPHNFGNNQSQNSNGTWGPSGVNNSNGSNSSVQQQQQTQNPNPIVPELPSTSSSGMGRVGGAASGGEYERGLVEALCAPGGMKAVPQEDKLSSFLRTAPTLSAELVGSALLDCMNDDSWQSRVKALIVLCRLMNTPSCEEHAVWWADNGEEDLISLQSDSKASVRTQASKALKLIGLEGEVAAVMEHAAAQRQKGNQRGAEKKRVPGDNNVSLLDFNTDSSVNATANQTSQSQPTQQMGGGVDEGLFSGLSLGSGGGDSIANVNINSPISQRQTHPQQQPLQATTSVFDSVGDSQNVLSFNDPLMNPPASSVEDKPPPPPPTASSAISSLDFLSVESSSGGNNSDDVPSRSRQSSVDVSSFDFMGGERERASSTDRNSLSGFDFMGGGGGNNLSPQQLQQQQLFIQQQQQLMQMQQQQFFMQQQQQHQQQQHGGHQHQQSRQYHPASGQLGNSIMGGIGMGRKHIPDPTNQQNTSGDGGFSFVSNSASHTMSPGSSGRKSHGNNPGDAFNFVSDTVAAKKASTNFTNKIT